MRITSRDVGVTMPPGRVLAVWITCLPVSLHSQTFLIQMSLADALNPQVSGNGAVREAYLTHDAKQPPPIDQDEEMDDLFDEDAVVDQAERYSSISPPVRIPNYLSIVRGNSFIETRPYRTMGRQTRFLMPNSVIERRWNTRRRKTNRIRITAMPC